MNSTTRIQRGSRAYYRTNLALFIAGYVTFSTLYDFQPLLPLLAQEFGISPALGSLPLSAATFALALALPVSGSISEALGRRKLMIAAVFLSSLMALATLVEGSLASLISMRLVQGIILAGVPAVAMAYLSEEMDDRAIDTAMGLYIAGNAVGGMSGRILTGFLADWMPWRQAIGCVGLLSLVLSVVFLLLIRPSRNFQSRPFRPLALTRSLLGHLREPGLLCLFSLAFLLMGGFVTLYNYIGFRLMVPPYSLGSSQISLIFLSYAFGAFGSGVVGSLVIRTGRGPILLTSLAVMSTGLLLTLAPQLPLIISGVVVFTIGFFAAHAVASAWVGQRAKEARAQASSLYLFAYYLGSSVSGTSGGFFWSAQGWPGVVLLIAGLMGLAFVAARILKGLSPRWGSAPPVDGAVSISAATSED